MVVDIELVKEPTDSTLSIEHWTFYYRLIGLNLPDESRARPREEYFSSSTPESTLCALRATPIFITFIVLSLPRNNASHDALLRSTVDHRTRQFTTLSKAWKLIYFIKLLQKAFHNLQNH